ncbi:uncharacterized protein F4807DRAFT_422058 [Annulohypoxylon truncatum]|uniref:uncharacterized protein n=1 Tax=Annulohypoxylon truncatum TaxID=327061 RepID=UPI0020084F5A|nr:uncharacterized protein F4807DRAFT_422058 [Annulohypoxylon truncatum]KAI1210620.1 hypothetical protein F4807DRAFT_422058 [Annulohypoxylon truncatum]
MEPDHIFYRMPPELIVKIYKRMNDIGDVKATLSTCRRAKAIFDEHAGAIAKSHLLRTIHPINVKLMVMAVASRDVDPRDQKSVEQFFRSYIWRAEPWPASYITMEMVAALPFFYGCMNLLFERIWIGLWREFSGIPPTDAELARVLRTFLMIETATNLFYRAPGKNGEALRRAPHVEWVDRYWEVFSHAEIEVVLKTKPHYSGRFEYGTYYPKDPLG